jgi:hypothetical protein
MSKAQQMIECNSALEFRDPAHLSIPIIFVRPPLVERPPPLLVFLTSMNLTLGISQCERSFRPSSQTSSKLNSPSEDVYEEDIDHCVEDYGAVATGPPWHISFCDENYYFLPKLVTQLSSNER